MNGNGNRNGVLVTPSPATLHSSAAISSSLPTTHPSSLSPIPQLTSTYASPSTMYPSTTSATNAATHADAGTVSAAQPCVPTPTAADVDALDEDEPPPLEFG